MFLFLSFGPVLLYWGPCHFSVLGLRETCANVHHTLSINLGHLKGSAEQQVFYEIGRFRKKMITKFLMNEFTMSSTTAVELHIRQNIYYSKF